jgi:hypothetical protein
LFPALAAGERTTASCGCFTSGETTSGIYWRKGWVGSRASLDDVEKVKFLTLLGLQPLGHPASSQSNQSLLRNSSQLSKFYLLKNAALTIEFLSSDYTGCGKLASFFHIAIKKQ